MMFSTFLRTQPPLAVFICALFSLSLLALFFSIKVSYTEKIRNPDVLDYDGLFGRLAKLNFCVRGVSAATSTSRRKRNLNRMEETNSTVHPNDVRDSVSVLVPFATEFVQDFHESLDFSSTSVVAEGVVLLENMKRASFKKYEKMHLTLRLNIPNPPGALMENTKADQDVCVDIEGPTVLLSDLAMSKSGPKKCRMPHKNKKSKGRIMFVEFDSLSKDHTPVGWCDARNNDTTRMRLTYEETPAWTVLVSDDDRRMIRMHLLATSAFLFAIAVCVILGAVCRSGRSSRGKLVVGDGRGDLELVSQQQPQLDSDE